VEKKKRRLGYLFILPSLIIIFFVLLFPLLFALYMSFFDVVFAGRSMKFYFAGFENYLKVLRDQSWWRSFMNTIYFVLADIFIGIPLGFISALALNRKLPLRSLIIGIVMLPYILPPIVHALIWKWIYNADYGFLNATLLNLGITKETILWLVNPKLALISLIIANLWQGTAFATIIYLGGLKSIPGEIFEAAQIDGATKWHITKDIVIPLLKPFTYLLLIMKTILTFKIFDLVYAVTGGGPAGSTKVVSLEIYYTAFNAFKFGKASAMSYILLGIVAIIVAFYQKFFRTEIEIL